MHYQLSYIYTFIPHLLLCIIITSFCIKLLFIATISYKKACSSSMGSAPYYLLATLFFSLFSDIGWAIKLFHKIITPHASYALVTFFIRIGWASIGLQHQYLALFIQKLIKKNAPLGVVQTLITGIAYIFLFYFTYNAFFSAHLASKESQLLAQKIIYNPPLEVTMVRLVTMYLASVLIIAGISIGIHHLRSRKIPKIVKKQLFIFIFCFVFPYLAIELLQGLAITFSILEQNLYMIVGMATILLIIAMHYALKHLLMLRFMNWNDHVLTTAYKKNATLFKNILEQLSHAQTIQEFQYISQHFFIHSFGLCAEQVMLHFPHKNSPTDHLKPPHPLIDLLINTTKATGTDYLHQHRILVYDDIAFNHFYKSSPLNKELMNSLDALDADVFLPLYHNKCIIASIIIKKNARSSYACYSKTEQDAMLMFAHYVGSSINLMHSNKTDVLINNTYLLAKKIYLADQEIALFKESIRSFIHTHKQQNIGLLFYHNNLFISGNQYTSELLPLSFNHQKGHPLVKQIITMSQKIMLSKTPQTLLCNSPIDKHTLIKNPIALSGSMQLDRQSVLITVRQASIGHMLHTYDYLLYNPADWYYILFLQTTMVGILLQSHIPLMSEYSLNLKITILKALLNPQPLLINAHEDDIDDFISFAQQLYSAQNIHVIPINHQERAHQSAHLLFGNRSSEHSSLQRRGLLEKNDKNTLVIIKNIPFMHSDGQQKLASFIDSGTYTPFNDNGDKQQSSTRIIVTVSESVQQMLHNGMLDKNLYQSIKVNKVTIPPLATWPTNDFLELIETILEQSLTLNPLQHLATITDKNKKALCSAAPASMQALHKKINAVINNKISSNSNKSATFNDPLTETDHANLLQIAQLGKKALKDSDKMRLLWQAFHSQHAIARFLGVHASTVHLKCKKYGLQ